MEIPVADHMVEVDSEIALADSSSLDDDYPLQPILSKRVAIEEVPRGSM